ncbi:MAG: histidine phosphatase family protein [Gammaproteobacteria bacterium]
MFVIDYFKNRDKKIATPVSILMRHAHRDPISKSSFGNEVELNSKGIEESIKLSKILKNYPLRLISSPVKRCVQTAKLIMGDREGNVEKTSLLGDPGVFINNPKIAGYAFLENSVSEVVRWLLSRQKNPLGFYQDTSKQVDILLDELKNALDIPGVHIYITHDSILSIVLGEMFGSKEVEKIWPDYLEGVILLPHENRFKMLYRDQSCYL